MIGFIQVDPWLLNIGDRGTVQVAPNTIVDTVSRRVVQLSEVVNAAKGRRFVLIGEDHDNPEAHIWQAKVIQALHDAGRNVIVGYEMIQRPEQFALDLWTLGKLSESEFLEKARWESSWGFDFGLYRPIFDLTKRLGLRNVALNISRDWVRAVGQSGFESLPADIRAELPPLDLTNQQHRQVFEALMGGHPMGSPNIYAAQVLWDEAMADSALKYLAKVWNGPSTAFVVIAGNGHVMYGQGIGWRLWRRANETPLTIVTVESKSGAKVSRGAGHFVIGVHDVDRGA
jgi:uncharacterized iron-regulated protein